MGVTSHPSMSVTRISERPLALMWRGNILNPGQPTNHAERFRPLVAELARRSVETRQVVYFDEDADAVRTALLECAGVMVWINPLQDGLDRRIVDALLRDVAAAGVWVSAHPDVILKMGTKKVLHATRELGWGADTELYRSSDEFRLRFPVKLAVSGPRVLKPLRGNDGQGVLKIWRQQDGDVSVQSAHTDQVERMPLADLVARMEDVIAASGAIIDQAFQPNVSAGMVRCYMSLDRVAGFAVQTPRNSAPTESAPQFAMNSAKTMHGADAPQFSVLRMQMERGWIPGMMRILGLSREQLPLLWDADFLHRAPDAAWPSAHVLCEINVSSVSPFPEAAVPAIAQSVAERLGRT